MAHLRGSPHQKPVHDVLVFMELVVRRDPFGKTPEQTKINYATNRLSVARKTSINLEKKRRESHKLMHSHSNKCSSHVMMVWSPYALVGGSQRGCKRKWVCWDPFFAFLQVGGGLPNACKVIQKS